MKGAALPLAQKLLEESFTADVMLVTSMTCLSSLLGFLRRSSLAKVPCIYYMHENQLTYPIRPGGKRDSQLVLRQFHAQVAADAIWFNSEHNRSSWFRQLPKFLAGFPDHQGLDCLERLQAKSRVVPVGLTLPHNKPNLTTSSRPVLLWNQRWEWEKGTDRFVSFVKKFGPEGAFDVVLLGPEPRRGEPLHQELREFLGSRLLHCGWCERGEYLEWLERAAFTVSTARHEFFGISLLEAAAFGVRAYLPDDLSYPELIPQDLHDVCLYRSPKDLYRKVREGLSQGEDVELIRTLQRRAYEFDWRQVAQRYDAELLALLTST